MDKLIAVVFAFYAISKFSGCAYNGDVYLYSPQGDSNAIEKAVSMDAKLDIPLIP